MSIGPYRIIEALGKGANGEVYLAEDLRLGRKVAIKTLSAPGRTDFADARRWMLREARAAARLNHPHIAGVYDVVESPQGAHIVMEYVRGETLASRLRDGPLPSRQVIEIAIQLADALAEAHDMGVVHRDLKPGNVMLTPKGDVKILDFGLAQVRPAEPGSTPARSSRDFTLDGRQVGTPPYMPPEHLMGDPVDVRGDLYSLGVMLYELLTARRPFRGVDAMKLTMAILTEPTPKASGSNPAVPEALDAIVFRAMARLPQDRYASAAELATDLRRAAAGMPPAVATPDVASDAPTASRQRGAPMRPRGRRGAVAIASVGLLVALGVYAAVARGRSATSAQTSIPPVVAVLPLSGMSDDPQDESLATGVADSLISSLSRIPGLTVVSRQATLPYRDRKEGVDRIGRDLGANLMIDASVQRAGDKLRLALSLLRVGSNRVVWSNAYQGPAAEIFSLQSRAASELADAMRLDLSPEERRRIQEAPTRNLEAYADYMQARTFLERPDVKRNVDRAVALLQGALLKDPQFAKAYAALADGEMRKYEETRAIEWALKARDSATAALRLAPDDGAVRYSLALIDRAAGRYDEAIQELRRAIELQPRNDEAHSLLGQLLADRGDLDAGVGEIRKAIELHPNYWAHHHALAFIYFEAGRYQDAIAAASREVELQPDNPRGFQLLGTIYHAMGDKQSAAKNYREAIRLGPSPRAFTNLGKIYYDDRRFEEAARAYEQAAQLEPNPAKFRNLGDTYTRLGQPDKAHDAYRKAIRLSLEHLKTNPTDAMTLSALAVYEAKIGQRVDALGHAKEAVRLRPTSGDVIFRQAVVQALCGQPDESIKSLENALAHGYSRSFAKQEEDLTTIHSRPQFRALVDSR